MQCMPLLKQHFAKTVKVSNKSHSIGKFSAKALKKSASKECEQSEQLSPISTIFDTNQLQLTTTKIET